MILTPKEKANELATMHHNLIQDIGGELGQEILVTILAKQCALFAVDEILKALQVPPIENKGSKLYNSQIEYWQEVKEEIEKL
jgi:hypothetical protein